MMELVTRTFALPGHLSTHREVFKPCIPIPRQVLTSGLAEESSRKLMLVSMDT